ncbi:MAG: 30S ribosomal protein S16 [Deltaproteobacteria bacterium]|uniref:Small ribosomal subunit protein bS16 n=1 Tax=Candidatus Zymogenus saltonus TaxID=2844893 RepID=A0A9D8KH13_9DELT|nr:30S ribosomal protein S16 [Candidatus Zymogenus saltonus]
MPVKIRLQRIGAKKKPFYRIVVANSESPRNGRFIENVGTYNTLTDPSAVTLKEEKIKGWLEKGAIPTKIVGEILKRQGITIEKGGV